ncbi:Integral membrane protein [Caballeronia glathei]|jgi:putative Mn2+ efflux pump MntP|nr:putative Mn2+ efflux pump MntP [Paraburkholderia sp. BL8N3]CDY76324.1 Integral membrane protein [Caballeronia glathei]
MSYVHARLARYFMNFASTLLIAFAMSTDAFAAAVGKGATLHRPRIREALRTGLIFGVIEAATPLIGWALGRAAAPYVESWDHWIAFGLLALLGAHMIHAGLTHSADDEPGAGKPGRHSLWLLAVTGFATSIDAMAVGAGLAFIDVNILSTAATIGLATMVMVTFGVMVGRFLGAVAGKRAEIGGGLILIGIGSWILAGHLGYLA